MVNDRQLFLSTVVVDVLIYNMLCRHALLHVSRQQPALVVCIVLTNSQHSLAVASNSLKMSVV